MVSTVDKKKNGNYRQLSAERAAIASQSLYKKGVGKLSK